VGAGKAPENQARAAGENRSKTVGIELSLGARISKPERAKQFLRCHVSMRLKDAAPGFEQACVVGGRASDPLPERHDLAVEIVELAARSPLVSLQRQLAMGHVWRKIAV